ncbi:MAG: FAD-dependent oxidoreductase [bacterium]|nr:FAD-dependent oxidoreductase [bacterium]MCP5067663.1 FAD-dependent oxidoreductase [bacterium]
MSGFPTQARAVVVGGGIVGCSTAYHLAKLGWTDVVLLERARLTSGSTFHAAGLVGQLRSSASITRLLGESVALYQRLEEETGQATGWKCNGGLRLACSSARMAEYERQATTAHSFGMEMQLLTPKEARDLWPLMETHDVVGAAFLPTDGAASPVDLTQALARGARMQGATLVENCPVTELEIENGRVTAVKTPRGRIACEVVVNCCGQWAHEFGRLAGVDVPLVSVQHQFMISGPIDGVYGGLPTLRDPDRLTYYKEEVGGLVMGGYEPNPMPWAQDGIPEGFHFTLLDPDFDHFQQLAELSFPRVPALESAEIRQMINGPESFTPDGNFILGEAPERPGYFVGAGFNAFGIAAAGGAGWALAAWIANGEPPYDLWPVDIRRFGPPHRDIDWTRQRTLELYGKHYTISWPAEEHQSGRPWRCSPLYERLRSAGACFGEKLGWERPNWFAPSGMEARDEYSFGRPNWFNHVGEEHRAVRERVGLFDQSSFAKFDVTGRDAEKALDWLCSNDIAKPPGCLTYTQMLNGRGGIECDLTVARVDEDHFYLVTGTGFATHDRCWIERNLPAGLDVRLREVTEELAVLALMGPASRDVLAAVSDEPVSDAAQPFATLRSLSIAGASVRALRITYVGELGFELHVPTESACGVYDALMEAGAAHGIVNAGYRAIESLRLEKGYRAWAADITPNDTPLEAGLGWAVKLNAGTAFLGREALVQHQREGLKRRLVGLSVDDPDLVLLGRETIFRDDERVGWLTSAGWGYTVAKGIGYGYVRDPNGIETAALRSSSYELEVATTRVPAKLHMKPLYDPEMKRIRG